MKIKIGITLLLGAFFLSCSNKEMKISRSNFTVEKEITDFSPAYMIKNEDGNISVNKNNLIGNTHWVLSVDRELTLSEILPALQELTNKKFHNEGMHKDTKQMYFIYSDTLNKQNAYVKLPFTKFIPANLHTLKGNYLVLSSEEDLPKVIYKDTLQVVLNKDMSTEKLVSILIALEKQKSVKNLHKEVYIY